MAYVGRLGRGQPQPGGVVAGTGSADDGESPRRERDAVLSQVVVQQQVGRILQSAQRLRAVLAAGRGGGGDVPERLRDASLCDLSVLKTENGRKNVKSAPYRPILSANRTRQRPTAVCTHADPAKTGQNGGN